VRPRLTYTSSGNPGVLQSVAFLAVPNQDGDSMVEHGHPI
jgi:hypothetical protein